MRLSAGRVFPTVRMTSPTLTPPASLDAPPSVARARRWAGGLGIGVAGLTALWSWQLSGAWFGNPDLSHGIFAPLVFLYLWHESRVQGPPRFLPANRLVQTAILGCFLAGLVLFFLGGAYAVAVSWNHALVQTVVTTALVAVLLGTLGCFALRTVRWVPLTWASVVAVGVWLLSTPLPPGSYARLTLRLQLGVTEVVLWCLHVLGVPASREGNLLFLTHGTVGMEEACSGVRSLFSCIFAALFFSATLVNRPGRRAVIIALAVPLALIANVARSLLLTLLADAGVNISGTWHDVTGFAALGITATVLGGVALWLGRGTTTAIPASGADAVARPERRLWCLPAAAGLVIILVVAVGGACQLTRPGERLATTPPPDLAHIVPPDAPDWQSVLTDDLTPFARALATDHLMQRTYVREGPTGRIELNIYVAYWGPGQAPVSLVAAHTPDACWPGAGWQATPVPTPRVRPPLPSRTLPEAEYREFTDGHTPQHVWYWHLHAGRPIEQPDPFSPRDLLLLALRHEWRRNGDQLLVRLSSNVPWDQLANDPLVVQLFERLQPLGL